METLTPKKEFLINEFLMFSLNAGLQTRSFPVYLITGKESNDLKIDIKNFLVQYVQGFEKSTEKDHYDTIELMANFISEKYNKILINGRFRIGVSQKIINLFLKYMWTVGEIKTPYHCPFDSIIKSKLLKGNNTIYLQDWTMLDNMAEYDKYVTLARFKAAEIKLTIAEWELKSWNRR